MSCPIACTVTVLPYALCILSTLLSVSFTLPSCPHNLHSLCSTAPTFCTHLLPPFSLSFTLPLVNNSFIALFSFYNLSFTISTNQCFSLGILYPHLKYAAALVLANRSFILCFIFLLVLVPSNNSIEYNRRNAFSYGTASHGTVSLNISSTH